jgi:hypothetical protein
MSIATDEMITIDDIDILDIKLGKMKQKPRMN